MLSFDRIQSQYNILSPVLQLLATARGDRASSTVQMATSVCPRASTVMGSMIVETTVMNSTVVSQQTNCLQGHKPMQNIHVTF